MTTSVPVIEWHLYTEFVQPCNNYSVHVEGPDLALQETFEVIERVCKEKHRVSMVAFRQHKKGSAKRIRSEHRRLEREMKLLVESVKAAAACSSSDGESADKNTHEGLKELVTEQETLWKENLVLREEIGRREKLQQVILEADQVCVESETLTLLPSDPQSGWRVRFDRAEQSFHFHPFTRDEFDAGMKRLNTELARSVSSV